MKKITTTILATGVIMAGVGGMENIETGPGEVSFDPNKLNYYYQCDIFGNLTAEIITTKRIETDCQYISEEKINISEWRYDAFSGGLIRIEPEPTVEETQP